MIKIGEICHFHCLALTMFPLFYLHLHGLISVHDVAVSSDFYKDPHNKYFRLSRSHKFSVACSFLLFPSLSPPPSSKIVKTIFSLQAVKKQAESACSPGAYKWQTPDIYCNFFFKTSSLLFDMLFAFFTIQCCSEKVLLLMSLFMHTNRILEVESMVKGICI